MTDEGKPRRSVLLLEDDTPMAELIVRGLEGEFHVERASSAEEAEMLLATENYHVLLCDHMMPGAQQGLDFLVAAQQRFPQAKRILMTGYMNPDLISRSIAVAGLSACLMKPVKMDELRRLLHQTLGLDV